MTVNAIEAPADPTPVISSPPQIPLERNAEGSVSILSRVRPLSALRKAVV